MTFALFRRLLSLILGDFNKRLRDVTATARRKPSDPPEGLEEAIYEAVEDARGKAWAAASAFLRSEARRLGADEAWIAPRPQYAPQAVKSALRRVPDPMGSGWKRTQAVMAGHVLASARQAVADAVEQAPEVAELVDSLTNLDDDLKKFPTETRREIVKEVRRENQKPRRSMGMADALDALADRLKEVEDELKEDSLKERVPEIGKALEDLPDGDDYRRDSRGRLIARPFAWARVVRPSENGPCGFCAMLASRGPVYRSSKAAGLGVRSFHDNCRCEIVPVFTSRAWPGKEDAIKYADLYKRVVRDGGLHGAQARTGMDNALRGTRSAEKSAAREKERNPDE